MTLVSAVGERRQGKQRVLPLCPSRSQQQNHQSFVCPGGGGELAQAALYPRGDAGPKD